MPRQGSDQKRMKIQVNLAVEPGVTLIKKREAGQLLGRNGLFAMNTVFSKKSQNKWIYSYPDRTIKNEINYILTKDRKLVEDITVINTVSNCSNHKMVGAKIRINTKRPKKIYRYYKKR